MCSTAYFVIPTTGGIFGKSKKNRLVPKIPPVVGMIKKGTGLLVGG